MKILVKNFRDRAALEQFVSTIDMTKSHTIEGKDKELSRFSLNDLVSVLGVPVVNTENPTVQEKQNPRPDRGRRFKSSIN